MNLEETINYVKPLILDGIARWTDEDNCGVVNKDTREYTYEQKLQYHELPKDTKLACG